MKEEYDATEKKCLTEGPDVKMERCIGYEMELDTCCEMEVDVCSKMEQDIRYKTELGTSYKMDPDTSLSYKMEMSARRFYSPVLYRCER